jgi:hypothetical protein
MESQTVGAGIDKVGSRKIIANIESEPEKWCPRCRRYKSIKRFHRNISRYDGLSGMCSKCNNADRNTRHLRSA